MKNDHVYIEQILDAVAKIREFTKNFKYEQFLHDQKTQSAVIMQLALIGELAKQISKEIKSNIDLPWKDIAGFRDRAIHDYYQIDLVIVWTTISSDLKVLEESLQEFLKHEKK